MSREEEQNTITVELPIEAVGDVVRVPHIGSMRRDRWRERVSNPGESGYERVDLVAPAVVAWIERDEWEPLDLPEAGRKIRATLRDGRVETFKVREVFDNPDWAWVWEANSNYVEHCIQRTLDINNPGPADIIAWEYVDEPAVDLAALADKIAAAVNELREAIG